MDRFLLFLGSLLLASCSAYKEAAPAPAHPTEPQPNIIEQIPEKAIPLPPTVVKSTKIPQQKNARLTPKTIPTPSKTTLTKPSYESFSLSGISFSMVRFDSRSHRLKVVDQRAGPGSRFPSAREACHSVKGLAAINAGFFTPNGKPLGFVFTNSNRRGSKNSSSLGSGYFYESNSGKLALSRRQSFPGSAKEAIQTGPFLIEHGQKVSGLSSKNVRPRSLLLWDGGSNWGFATSSATSLSSLANALAGQQFAGRPIRYALNLDGGRSCDLFVSNKLAASPIHKRSIIAKPVRNFLILIPK